MSRIKKLTALVLCFCAIFSCCHVYAFAESGPVSSELPFENSAFFELGDYSVHYRTFKADEPKGQIFMIHGFALSSYCFVALAEKLVKSGYTCVLADLPDFGYSTRETAETEKLLREDIMYELMTSISDEPWYLAGHSMGGYVAVALAQKYPDSVKNLLLYGTSGNDGVDSAKSKLMSTPWFINAMGGVMESFGKCAPLVRLLYLTASQDLLFTMKYDISKITEPLSIKGTGAGAIYNFSMLPVTDYDAVKNMPPILYINGDRDYVINEQAREKLRTYLPEDSLDITVRGGGHMFIETHADAAAEYTINFING